MAFTAEPGQIAGAPALGAVPPGRRSRLDRRRRTGQIRGAALDVLEANQRSNPDPLDVVGLALTPHTASAGEATRDTVGIRALDDVSVVLAG
ncbi:MAG TPA: hypothetical protein VI029_12715 [Mycobacterium sp.]